MHSQSFLTATFSANQLSLYSLPNSQHLGWFPLSSDCLELLIVEKTSNYVAPLKQELHPWIRLCQHLDQARCRQCCV